MIEERIHGHAPFTTSESEAESCVSLDNIVGMDSASIIALRDDDSVGSSRVSMISSDSSHDFDFDAELLWSVPYQKNIRRQMKKSSQSSYGRRAAKLISNVSRSNLASGTQLLGICRRPPMPKREEPESSLYARDSGQQQLSKRLRMSINSNKKDSFTTERPRNFVSKYDAATDDENLLKQRQSNLSNESISWDGSVLYPLS